MSAPNLSVENFLRPVAIDWQGPLTMDDIRLRTEFDDAGLYQIYCHHPVFGLNSLY